MFDNVQIPRRIQLMNHRIFEKSKAKNLMFIEYLRKAKQKTLCLYLQKKRKEQKKKSQKMFYSKSTQHGGQTRMS